MIPNAWGGFDFGLGDDVDALRDSVHSFAQDRIAPRADAMSALRRAVDPGLHRWLYIAKIPVEYAAARRQDPAGVLKLLKPSTWRRGIRLIANGAKPK